MRQGVALPGQSGDGTRPHPYERPAAIATRHRAIDTNTYPVAAREANRAIPASSPDADAVPLSNYGLKDSILARRFFRFKIQKLPQHALAYADNPSFAEACIKNGRFYMNFLQPYLVNGSQNEEIHHATGALIARMSSARDARGQPIIQRMIAPMSGSGTYANFMRIIGFTRDIVVNDRNALAMIAHFQCIKDPDEVIDQILHLMTDIRAIGNKYGLIFDDNLVLREARFQRLPSRQPTDTQEWIGFNSHPNVNAFRDDMHDHFHSSLEDALIASSSGREISSTPRTAALFYLLQNNAQDNAMVSLSTLAKSPVFRHAFHVPVRFLSYSAKGIFAMRHAMFPGSIGLTIRAISHMHNANASTARTAFMIGDGCSLLKWGKVGKNDFTVLSRYFSELPDMGAAFFKQIDDYIVPSATRGGRFLITVRANPEAKARFQYMGFETKESVGTKRQKYLLAYNFDPHSPELDLRPLRRLDLREMR